MRRPRADAGDTLVEVLVALAILGIGVTALLSALAVMITSTGGNRSNARSQATLLSAAEYVKTMTLTAADYTACGPTPFTITNQIPVPTGMTATVERGSPAVTGGACTVLLKVPVRVTGDGFNVTVDVVRRP